MAIKNNKRVAILLATYNGGQYVKEQIDSIISQSYKNWTLYVRDDGSKDETLSIIDKYTKVDNRIKLFEDDLKAQGAKLSFIRLMAGIDSELYMFCDQDDVWLEDKVELSVKRYDESPNKDIPIVVHTDVAVVDDNLNILVHSHWDDTNLDPDKLKSYEYLCISCYTQGNTMLFNKKAKDLAFPLPASYLMHDWLISSRVLQNNGIIHTIYKPLVLYRQHGDNVCGFRHGDQNSIKSRGKQIGKVIAFNWKKYKELKAAGFGSFCKYVWYKMLVEFHMHFRKKG